MATRSAAVIGARPTDPFEIFKWQNDVIRMKQAEFIGKIMKIVVEASLGAAVPGQTETNTEGVALDFYGQFLALGQCAGELIILSPIIRNSDGRVGLPDKPDPAWVPRQGHWSDEDDDPNFDLSKDNPKGKFIQDKPRMIPQTLRTRGAKKLKGTDYLVIEPVHQILVILDGMPEGVIIQCGLDPATGTHKALVVNEATGEAHFYGGRHIITSPRLG